MKLAHSSDPVSIEANIRKFKVLFLYNFFLLKTRQKKLKTKMWDQRVVCLVGFNPIKAFSV